MTFLKPREFSQLDIRDHDPFLELLDLLDLDNKNISMQARFNELFQSANPDSAMKFTFKFNRARARNKVLVDQIVLLLGRFLDYEGDELTSYTALHHLWHLCLMKIHTFLTMLFKAEKLTKDDYRAAATQATQILQQIQK